MEMRQDFFLTPDVMDSITLQCVSFLQPPKQSLWKDRAGNHLYESSAAARFSHA